MDEVLVLDALKAKVTSREPEAHNQVNDYHHFDQNVAHDLDE